MCMHDSDDFLNELNPNMLPHWRILLKFHHLFYGWSGLDMDPIFNLLAHQRIGFMIDNSFGDPAEQQTAIEKLSNEAFDERFPGYERIGFEHYVDEQDGFDVLTLLYQKLEWGQVSFEDPNWPNRFAFVYQIRDARDAWRQYYLEGSSCPKMVVAIHPGGSEGGSVERILERIENLKNNAGKQPMYVVTHYNELERLEGVSQFGSFGGDQSGWRNLFKLALSELGAYPKAKNKENFETQIQSYLKLLRLIDTGEEIPENLLESMLFDDHIADDFLVEELIRRDQKVPPQILRDFLNSLRPEGLDAFVASCCRYPVNRNGLYTELIKLQLGHELGRRLIEATATEGGYHNWFMKIENVYFE